MIGGIAVLEAVKQGDKENIIDIVCTLEHEPNFSVGDNIEVQIDPIKRKKLQRLHSAAHVLYYIIIEKLGPVKIVGSNVASEKARLDFSYEESLAEKLLEIETAINEFITPNKPIIMLIDSEKPDLQL